MKTRAVLSEGQPRDAAVNFDGYRILQRHPAVSLLRLKFLPRDASAERGDATVSCPSVCLSVCNVQVPCSNRLEFLENNFTAE